LQLKSETKVGFFVLIAGIILAYMAAHLGVFKFYMKSYKSYFVYFKDINGLENKADVKIAGVKVGWIDNINLLQNDVRAKIKIKILDKYCLYDDAYARIHQEGLLGKKYLELIPGTPGLSLINSEGTLGKSVKQPASVEDLMSKFEKIANNIEDVSASLKGAFGTPGQQNQLRSIISNINEASSKIAIFTDVLARNQQNIDGMIHDFRTFSKHIAPIGQDIQRAAQTFDNNFSTVAQRLDATLKNISSIAEKIDQGRGLIGKLVNEDEVYDDLKVVAGGFREMAEVADKTGIVFDTHFETMGRLAEHYEHRDSKGYFDIRLHTNEDTFYQLQLVGSEKGSINRTVDRNQYFDYDNRELTVKNVNDQFGPSFQFPPPRLDTLRVTRNTLKFGLQIGKTYKDLALRFGIFENYVGAAIDYELPFCNENFRWVTTLEMFDFRGQDRIDDRRPHLKWINRVFFMKNLYMDFGADDFVSRKNANPFFGCGIRFSDDDIKYLLAKFGSLVSTGALGLR